MRLRPRTALAAGAAALALAALAPATPALAGAPPDTQLLAQRGFGDPRNVYAWSMQWFKGTLYVGTGRQVACVENQTVDYFLRVSNRYITRPYPGARCPADPYDMDLRAEIWQYTPRTGAWRRVYKAPADIPNPRAKGETVARDIAYRGMAVYRDGQGRKTLYVGGVTANEYIPEIRRAHPPRILSTRDGVHFRATEADDVVVRAPYGDFRPMGFRSMQVWKDRLYVTATPGLTGDGAIFLVKRPWSAHPRFKQVTPKSMAVFEMETFDGGLWAGTGDREDGYGLYRIDGRPGRYRITPHVTGGAGRGAIATSVVSMQVFRNELYVGSSGWYNEQELPISELIRINKSDNWQVVSGAPRKVGNRTMRPASGLSDGFDNLFAAHFWRMERYRGALYVGTNDWSWIVQSAMPEVEPWVEAAVQSALMPDMGFDLWASCNGRDWFPVTRDGLDGNPYDFGARNLVASPGGLYVGSANHSEGTKIWRTRLGACEGTRQPPGRPHRAKPTRGERDRKHGGHQKGKHGHDGRKQGKGKHDRRRPRAATIAWRPAPGAARYRVMRAEIDPLRLSLVAPPVFPNGFRLEDQLPVFVPPGTPGAKQVSLPLMGEFAPVATTRSASFTDPDLTPGARYAYEVIAETPAGEPAARSGVSVVDGG